MLLPFDFELLFLLNDLFFRYTFQGIVNLGLFWRSLVPPHELDKSIRSNTEGALDVKVCLFKSTEELKKVISE